MAEFCQLPLLPFTSKIWIFWFPLKLFTRSIYDTFVHFWRHRVHQIRLVFWRFKSQPKIFLRCVQSRIHTFTSNNNQHTTHDNQHQPSWSQTFHCFYTLGALNNQQFIEFIENWCNYRENKVFGGIGTWPPCAFRVQNFNFLKHASCLWSPTKHSNQVSTQLHEIRLIRATNGEHFSVLSTAQLAMGSSECQGENWQISAKNFSHNFKNLPLIASS